ncbi:MAG: hypothetical protein RL685_60 [Pseudomonadota bacterium]
MLAGALGGCGGDSTGESSGVDTGLAESTALRDVTSDQSVTACQNIRGAINEQFGVEQNVRKACELMGAALTDTPAACATQADSCVTQVDEGTNPFFQRADLDFATALECDGDTSDYADCDVTVGELESCMDARLVQVQELFAQFSCAAAATIGIGDAQMLTAQIGDRETPAACQRLSAECPRAEPFSSAEEAQ